MTKSISDEMVRIFGEEAPDEFRDYVLWSRTSFPFSSQECVIRELEETKALMDQGVDLGTLCDHCNEKEERPGAGLCSGCSRALKEIRNKEP